jgi:hypothetical protein
LSECPGEEGVYTAEMMGMVRSKKADVVQTTAD